MLKNKTLLTLLVIFLLLTLSLTHASARPRLKTIELLDQELKVLDNTLSELMTKIETEAQNYYDILKIIKDFCENRESDRFPIIKQILNKIISWITSHRGYNFRNNRINNLFDRGYLSDRSADHFVISYGSYNRLNPFKENEINIFKQGFGFWRYSSKSRLLKGRTLIVQRNPFGIERIIGPQLGLMLGFRGLYIDVESELTGMSYVLFIGRANRIRAIEISSTLFSNLLK